MLTAHDREGRLKLEKLARSHRCAVCGGRLEVAYLNGLDDLICGTDKYHEGIEKTKSAMQMYREGSPMPVHIANKLEAKIKKETEKEMTEKVGETKALELAKYAVIRTMTPEIATRIVDTLWQDAPIVEKKKAILYCSMYNLNPLAKHIYLVSYKKWNKEHTKVIGEDWAMLHSIQQKRLLANRKHHFTYLDMSPRKATQQEIDIILGDTADKNTIYGFTHIKDLDTGAESWGLRGWNLKDNVKGTDKGNTALNMACTRSESQSIERLYPGEMPSGVDVIDERFMATEEITNAEFKVINETTGEIKEGNQEPPPDAPAETTGGLQPQGDTKVPPQATEAVKTTERKDPAITSIGRLFAACFDFYKMQPPDVLKELGISDKMEIADPATAWETIKNIKQGK